MKKNSITLFWRQLAVAGGLILAMAAFIGLAKLLSAIPVIKLLMNGWGYILGTIIFMTITNLLTALLWPPKSNEKSRKSTKSQNSNSDSRRKKPSDHSDESADDDDDDLFS